MAFASGSALRNRKCPKVQVQVVIHLRSGMLPFKAVRFCDRSPSGSGGMPHIQVTLLQESAVGVVYGSSRSASSGVSAKIALPCGFSTCQPLC